MMRQDTIHINDLSIGYRTKNDTKLVASHIQARIYSGELTCLLGANGVGKSTLLRTLSAFQPKLGGEIAVLGRDMDSYSDKELFDTETGLFRIDNRYSKEIRLIGHGQKYAMVRKALQRNGIRADRHVESPVWIETGDLSVGSAFLIHHLDGRTLAADTIESLLQELSV